jgi:hypothetical protein
LTMEVAQLRQKLLDQGVKLPLTRVIIADDE